MTCATCIHWDRYDTDLSKRVGDCRLNPPTVSETLLARFATPPSYRGPDPKDLEIEVDLYAASVFPVTHEDSRCGRYAGSFRMSALGKIAPDPASDNVCAAWGQAESWYRSLANVEIEGMPEEARTSVDHALCAAMNHLVENIPAPDARALVLKMEIARDCSDAGMPSKWWDVLEGDVVRLVRHSWPIVDKNELDGLIAKYVETGSALSASAGKGLPDGNPIQQAYLAATEALDAYQPRNASEFVRSLAGRFGEDASLPTEDAMIEIVRTAVRLVAEGF